MKTLPSGMQAHLDSGATTLCWCWRVARGDGMVQGFTDHDAAVIFDGTSFAADTGFAASEVQSSLGLAVDNLSAIGALSSGAIDEASLAAGLYDNAAIEIWRVNWADPDQRVLIRKGTLGEVKRGRSAFAAEVRGLAQALNQPVGRAFGYSCDADLGDPRCTIDLTGAAFHADGAVTSVTDARRFVVSGLDDFTSGWFSGGKLVWTSGANNGRAIEVKRHALNDSGVSITLWQAMSEPVGSGDTFAVTAGCDKQFGTCKAKFANSVNFRGFPHMPGNDGALAYPVRGQPLDGGSRYGH